MASAEAPWVKFSQSEDLTVRLRNILHDYAFGPGVFRELLQNADDAGARRLVLLADGNSYAGHGTGLLDARLEAWQGPAICAFNDAEFSDSDFDGICRVGASGKRGDESKIGHYGLGFNATYHLSDVVSFVSRDRLCIFDPHETHLPEGLPGLQLQLGSAEIQSYRAQLLPFESAARACGAQTWPLRGALFRLPLRNPELASRSKICPESHSFADMLGVLHDFLHNSHELLLFLQSVESIDVLVCDEGSTGPARRIGGASVRTASQTTVELLRKERRLFTAAGPAGSQHAASYAFAVETDTPAKSGAAGEGTIRATSAWLVAARCESDGRPADQEDELPRRRCAAVAMRLWPPVADEPLPGRAFCFLPLSLDTGLPAHISANFALTANRRDLWRRSDDKDTSHSMKRAAWNEALLAGTLPRVYLDALELRATVSTRVIELLPEGPWDAPLRALCLPAELWGQWPSSAQAAFAQLPEKLAGEIFTRGSAVFWDDAMQRFSPPKAVLLCSETEYARFSASLKSALSKLRVAGSHRGVVALPELLSPLLSDVKGAVWLSAKTVSTAFRSTAPVLEREEAEELVAYLLGPAGTGPFTALHGLKLCPLAGGGLGLFEKPGLAEELWWTEDIELCELLPGRQFVDPSSATFQLLKKRIANAPLNVQLLNAKAVPLLLPAIVPPSWRGKRKVCSAAEEVLVDGMDAKSLPAVHVQQEARGSKSRGASAKSGPKASVAPAGRRGAKAKKPTLSCGPASMSYDDDDAWYDYEGDDYDGEDCGVEQRQESGAVAQRGYSHAREKTAADESAVKACTCATAAELEGVVRRCELLWRVIEHAHEKGADPVQLVSDLPCVPLVEAPSNQLVPLPRLVSVLEARRCNALAAEDFPQRDREVLQRCGVPFIRPGKRLRGALGINKSLTLAAVQAAFAERWQQTPSGEEETNMTNSRLHQGLRPRRVPCAEAAPLRALILELVQKRIIPKDSRELETLPIFETLGGRFSVPLVPVNTRIMTPNSEWDEALRPQFADYLLQWEGETGKVLAELGRERGSTSSFLSEFAAARVGLFDQALCVKFLEDVAALGNTPWKRPGAPKELEKVAQSCIDAPLVVFPGKDGQPPFRVRCSDVCDPQDAALAQVLGDSVVFPPEAYCGPLSLTVMRRAGLRSLSDEAVFLSVAQRVEHKSGIAEARALLRHLGERHETVKWPSKAFAALSKLRIFPATTNAMRRPLPPENPCSSGLVALDGPCTLAKNANVAWTQLHLLEPSFDEWPQTLLRRFGAMKDPVPLETVVANMLDASEIWLQQDARQGPTCAEETAKRQAIVGQNLQAMRAISQRRHATQTMVQHRLGRAAFVVLDDGSRVKPVDIFAALHAACDSGSEDEGAHGGNEEAPRAPHAEKRKRGSAASRAGPWTLPAYLRPHRRLLLTVAGPTVSAQRQVPTVIVGAPPADSIVPDFIRESLNRPELADVEFVVSAEDGAAQTVFAHRLVLAAACEHFRRVFTSGLSEGIGGVARCRIDLPAWVSFRPLLWMLAYLYRGYDAQAAHEVALRLESAAKGVSAKDTPTRWRHDLEGGRRRRPQPHFVDEESGEDLCCLLRLAEFYGLEHLGRWAESRLQAMMTPENLLALSTHAYFCNASQLLRVCVYNMQVLYADLASGPEWEELDPAIRELVLVECQDS
eukprot:TRINITY_DN57364_c0_g1_i1.p1 TRINITY_DN57364_c0_g1~~TRINITY_DN57364_c0_g1_i1.p1  ORF type:complete len:1669 (-),score=270.95 TRINITY_DN57364_c0_g1_i1:122-5128(-)